MALSAANVLTSEVALPDPASTANSACGPVTYAIDSALRISARLHARRRIPPGVVRQGAGPESVA